MKEWKEYKLNELGKVNRGKSKHRPRNEPALFGGKYPFIQTGDIKAANFYINEYSQTYSEMGLSQSKLWKKGTLCVTIAANIAETAILDMDACFPDSIIGFVADEKKSDVKFIKYHFDLLKLHLQSISQGTTQDNLSQEKLLSFVFKAPSLLMQQKIAGILSTYDDLIETNTQRIQLLEETAQQLYKEWFVRMRFPDYKKVKFVKGVPNWEEIKFGDIVSFSKGLNPKELFEISREGFKLYVNIEAIEGGKQTFCNDKKTVDVKDNEVVMIMDGSRSGVVLKSKAGVLGSTLSVIRCKKGFEDFDSYLFYFLKQNFDWIESNNVGSAIPHANRKFIQQITLLKPPIELIKKFENIAKPMEILIENLQQQNTQLRQIRDRLLPRLVSGQLVVKSEEVV